jgi:hypothetical protein
MRAAVKPGDVFAFSGNGLPSKVVKIATQSQYVHVAIVVWVDQRAAQNNAILLAESHIDLSLPSVGTGDRRLGVQFQWLDDRLQHKPGPIWWLPLRDTLDSGNISKMQQWLQLTEAEKRPYDFKQAIGIGLTALGWDKLNQADDNALFCSELVTRSLQIAGVLDSELNAATCTPANVIDFPCFHPPILLKSQTPSNPIDK